MAKHAASIRPDAVVLTSIGAEHHRSLGAAAAVQADVRAGDVVLIKGRSTQRLERIALMLEGREVGCDLAFCKVETGRCESCPMLERGWPDQRTAAALLGRAAVAG